MGAAISSMYNSNKTNKSEKQFENFYHIDAYRMKDYKDAKELGLKELFKKPENIIAIEWPERIKKILPKNAIKINFKFISEFEREIEF